MSWDIYGNPLQRGHCEVHPHVHEEYPCSLCMSERGQIQQPHDALEQLQYEFAQQGDYIKQLQAERDALAAELSKLCEFRDNVVGVMNESNGVVGWHKNHAVATWDELFPMVPDFESPLKCLRYIQAEAVMQAVQFFKPARDIDAEALEAYAAKVRQGGE